MAETATGPNPASSHVSPGRTCPRSNASRSTRTMIFARAEPVPAPAPRASSTRASAA
jgi:hypothetical protein